MKNFLLLIVISFFIYSCGTTNNTMGSSSNEIDKNEVIRIANDSLEYEIIIIENGFESWLATQPQRGYYGQSFLEAKNRSFVSEYNTRVLQPQQYSKSLYGERINYDTAVDYGYEVNYMLYNYFLYFQNKYNQNFIGGRN